MIKWFSSAFQQFLLNSVKTALEIFCYPRDKDSENWIKWSQESINFLILVHEDSSERLKSSTVPLAENSVIRSHNIYSLAGTWVSAIIGQHWCLLYMSYFSLLHFSFVSQSLDSFNTIPHILLPSCFEDFSKAFFEPMAFSS